uniref:Mannosyltransferase n=1 Tax=Timema tahoe TaxID=61484 RepID=A0A7R9FL11_9NEOP|nr:unnamed protein product [Timema tahoe]
MSQKQINEPSWYLESYDSSATRLNTRLLQQTKSSSISEICHDLAWGCDSQYDHHEFPGVVPRTFIGAIGVSVVSAPFLLLVESLGLSKFLLQYIVRSVLALFVIGAFQMLRQTLQSMFGLQFTKWFVAITVTQYHFMFYLSRPLPNIMALPLELLLLPIRSSPRVAAGYHTATIYTKPPREGKTGNKISCTAHDRHTNSSFFNIDGIETLVTVLIALHSWLRQQHGYFIFSSAAAIIIFRAELALFLGLILILELVQSRLHPVRLIKLAVPAGLLFLALTVAIDSVFWGKLLWPEGEVLFFNTVLNKSHQWGTSPFLWYFYSAIPRGMACSVFLVPIGAYLDTRVRKLLIPAIGFVVLFSFLPHKELRFIIYVFPLLNIAAASACHRIFENRSKSSLHSMLALGVCCHLVLNSTFSVFLLCIAGTNYPGGAAIARLHRLAKDEPYVNVHIAVLAAQTGVSRFTQINRHWRYNKTENLTSGSDEMMAFTHLLVEAKSKYSSNLKPYAQTHDILEVIEGFSQVVLNYNSFPPIRIKTKPMIFILKRRIFSMHVEKTMVKTDIEDVEDKSKGQHGRVFGSPWHNSELHNMTVHSSILLV